MALSRGDAVRLEMTKWGDQPHWEMDAVYLGHDRHGDWIGFPPGTRMARPGVEVVTPVHQVALVPDGPWLPTFHDEGGSVRIYVDMTTVPVWDGNVVRAVDLDLDVIELTDGTVYVDDEDEFEEHQKLFGYPRDVVELAAGSRDSVLDAVTRHLPPFDGSDVAWLDELRELAP